MGQFGRITSLSDLPGDGILMKFIRKAAELNEAGVRKPGPKRTAANNSRKKLTVPSYFLAALAKNVKARQTFENFSYSHKKEYVQWITEAKRDETREKRIKAALQWLASGKSRNWKYENC